MPKIGTSREQRMLLLMVNGTIMLSNWERGLESLTEPGGFAVLPKSPNMHSGG